MYFSTEIYCSVQAGIFQPNLCKLLPKYIVANTLQENKRNIQEYIANLEPSVIVKYNYLETTGVFTYL